MKKKHLKKILALIQTQKKKQLKEYCTKETLISKLNDIHLDNGENLLHYACKHGNYRIYRFLKRKGVEIKEDENGNWPLHVALQRFQNWLPDIVQAQRVKTKLIQPILIDHSHVMKKKNKDGLSCKKMLKKLLLKTDNCSQEINENLSFSDTEMEQSNTYNSGSTEIEPHGNTQQGNISTVEEQHRNMLQGRDRDVLVSEKDITVPSELASIIHNNNMNGSKAHEEDLRLKKIFVRKGRWLKEEDSILVNNFEIFKKLYPNIDALEFLDTKLYANSGRLNIIRQRKETDFFLILGGNLNRTSRSCFDRAQKLLLPGEKGTYSEYEAEHLKSLAEKYRGRWSEIGRLMGRQGQSCLDKVQHMEISKNCNTGAWSSDENTRLVKCLQTLMEEKNVTNIEEFQIDYIKLEEMMKTRSRAQIQGHWKYTLYPKLIKTPSTDLEDPVLSSFVDVLNISNNRDRN